MDEERYECSHAYGGNKMEEMVWRERGTRPRSDNRKLKNDHPEKANGNGKTPFTDESPRWHIHEKSKWIECE